MLQFIQQIFTWLRGGSLKLLTLAGIILLLSGIFSPVGTLVWWINEGTESLGIKKNEPKQITSGKSANSVKKSLKINCYIVFLPGVGNFSSDQLTDGEAYFVDRLVKNYPNCVGVRDVFPYSVANKNLGGERLLAPLWRFANKGEGWLNTADILIKIRNLWRFAISIDNRYGPVYNQGIATAIIERMNAAYPIPNSNQQYKIILVGTSGGAQVALGAATYLDEWLDTDIVVISVGGVFSGTDGFYAAERVYHFRGRKDSIEDIGGIIFPSRWFWIFNSPFNQARQQGNYTAYLSGPHAHDGSKGYFGEELIKVNNMKYVDLTIQKVNKLPIWTIKIVDI